MFLSSLRGDDPSFISSRPRDADRNRCFMEAFKGHAEVHSVVSKQWFSKRKDFDFIELT